MSQFLREFWSLDVSCRGPSRLSRSAGPIRSELRCLAAGQPSRPISVEAPLWSQVVGSAYREDQQRSVSLLHSLSLSVQVLYISSLLLSHSCCLPSPLLALPPSPTSCFYFFLLKSPYFYLHLIIVIPPFLSSSSMLCVWLETTRSKCFGFFLILHFWVKMSWPCVVF